eukprot:TRINITY_DN212_c0_g1_i2.p1 TRINITY_DN212_c0_g1~~TRINITY_DN212_c0_g1_i2.p1  ORF type:complete len:359 (+),score=37.58 TRINITY_DN212_c0_g1_i2:46-1077(+)
MTIVLKRQIVWANKTTEKAKHRQKKNQDKQVTQKEIRARIFSKIKTGRSYKQLKNLVTTHNTELQQAHVEELLEKVTGIYNANRLKLDQAQQVLSDAITGCVGTSSFSRALLNYLELLLQKRKTAEAVDLIWQVSQLELLQNLKIQDAKKMALLLHKAEFSSILSFQKKCKLFNAYLYWKYGGDEIQQETDEKSKGYFLNGKLFEACELAWIESVSQSRLISKLQQEVYEICEKVFKVEIQSEKITEDGYWSIDVAAQCGDKLIAIEVEGREHLSSNNLLKRKNFLRYQALKSIGWSVIVVPFTEWNRCLTATQKMKYIQNALFDIGVSQEYLKVLQTEVAVQ